MQCVFWSSWRKEHVLVPCAVFTTKINGEIFMSGFLTTTCHMWNSRIMSGFSECNISSALRDLKCHWLIEWFCGCTTMICMNTSRLGYKHVSCIKSLRIISSTFSHSTFTSLWFKVWTQIQLENESSRYYWIKNASHERVVMNSRQ